MVWQTLPTSQCKGEKSEAAQGGTGRIDACSQSTAVRSIGSDPGLLFLFVGLDKCVTRRKNRRECQKESADAWPKAFCDQSCSGGTDSPEDKTDHQFEGCGVLYLGQLKLDHQAAPTRRQR